LVPRWWEVQEGQWALREPASTEDWFTEAYHDKSLITRIGPTHADCAKPDEHPLGRPTSSATLPSLVVRMFQYARIDDGDELLDVGTGSGYGAALAAYRLNSIGLQPTVETVDATGPLPVRPGQFDRIVATVSVRSVPVSWLQALCTGGRLVTTIAGTSLILTAEKRADGAAVGRVEWDRAGFMQARHGDDYPPALSELLSAAHDQDGDDVRAGPYPAVDVANAWDLDSMLGITAPGIEHAYHHRGEQRTAVMAHADGSWARATTDADGRTLVHQGGPRRLWDILDGIRAHWLQHGELPARGAQVLITPQGETRLARGKWRATL
jgi:protein-L-isoaspartate O-methyltransferase